MPPLPTGEDQGEGLHRATSLHNQVRWERRFSTLTSILSHGERGPGAIVFAPPANEHNGQAMKVRAAVLAPVAFAVALAPFSAAAADPIPSVDAMIARKVTFSWDRSVLRATVSFRDALEGKVVDKVTSGLPWTVAVRALLYRDGQAAPVALAVQTCRITFDLWDEVYRTEIRSAAGNRNQVVSSLESALAVCVELRSFAVASQRVVDPRVRHRLAVLAEVNPISPEMIEQLQRWVSRPVVSAQLRPGDALFGSFAGLFMRELGKSDQTIVFRSEARVP